ncbi:MAG: lipopolysaccharide kinase InaA family protein [Planctomycetota bacterium]
MPASPLPAGFLDERRRGARLAVRADYAQRFCDWGLRARGGEPFEASELHGRRPLATVRGSAGQVLVRRFRHGGLFAPVTGDRFLDRARPFRELALAERLRALGIATPAVVAARARRCLPFGWRLELFTLRVEGARDLAACLDERRERRLTDAEWRALVRRAGDLVGRAHAAGFVHADLHPKNILEAPDGTLMLLDLDGSRFVDALDDAARTANLERLWRWVARDHARTVSRADRWRFLTTWEAAGGSNARAAWLAVEARFRRNAALHRAGRRLQGR